MSSSYNYDEQSWDNSNNNNLTNNQTLSLDQNKYKFANIEDF